MHALSERDRRSSRYEVSHGLGSRGQFGAGDHMVNVMDVSADACFLIVTALDWHQEGPDPQIPVPARPAHRGPPLICRLRITEAL